MGYTSAAIAVLGIAIFLRQGIDGLFNASRGKSVETTDRVPPAYIAYITDSLITTWTVLCVYSLLLLVTQPIEITWPRASLVVVPLASAAAALNRWRWSRYALLGMAWLLLLDTGWAATRVAISHQLSVAQVLGSRDLWEVVFSGFTGSSWFGEAAVVFAAISVGWFMLPAVTHPFEYRKRSRTRNHQFGIATALVSAYLLGLTGAGLTRNVDGLLTDRAQAAQLYERIAMRSGATIPRGVRR